MTTATLLKTALHDWHQSHGGKLVDFAGWSMPVQYDSIITEHHATRQNATLFDVSHMGRFRIDGAGGAEFLDRLVTRRVTNLKPGQIRYGLVTNEVGGILDDVLVYRLIDHDGQQFHALVVNAGNREKIRTWFQPYLDAAEVTFTDQTLETAMIAVQGPRAIAMVDRLVDISLAELPYYHGCCCHISGIPATISRTGYTGEDGCEITVANESACEIWSTLIDDRQTPGVMAAGLGARDTLRLEAAMPLYGHELSEMVNPYQAGLGFAVHLDGRDFVGRDALLRLRSATDLPVRIGLRLDGKRVPREDYPVLAGDEVVGKITSGTFSPTLDCPLAMAYVSPAQSAIGNSLNIDIRGRQHPATVVTLPFYVRPSH